MCQCLLTSSVCLKVIALGLSPSVEKCCKSIHTDVLFDAEQHLMGTKALFPKGKEIQRAEALQDKNPLLLKNSEKVHTYVRFDAEQHFNGHQSSSAYG